MATLVVVALCRRLLAEASSEHRERQDHQPDAREGRAIPTTIPKTDSCSAM